MDKLAITILEDGTIKVDVDRVSMPNHASAEEFLRLMAELANGGRQERTRKGQAEHHHHAHAPAEAGGHHHD